mmetsp:Transcript_46639/g.123171  ORF Transcript_46639/g.123171 Transcript_46639/m.123171 type:complete len:403 (+) Transcript_46639:65-1273(+)
MAVPPPPPAPWHRKSKVSEPPRNQKWVWTALATGNADLVEMNDPGPEFEWNGSCKTYGTPLMAAIFAGPRTSDRGCTDFVTDNEPQFQNRLRLMRWMIMERDTDPKKEETAGCCADKSWSITDDDEVHSQTRTLSFRGHSAFSALLEVRMHMLAAEGDWRSDVGRIDRILELFSATRPKAKAQQPQTVAVHEAVVEMWERYMDDDAGKDLTLRCMRECEELGAVSCHSALLASVSPVVRAMLSGVMRESAGGTCDVECRVDSMRLFLSLVYTGSVAAEDDPLSADVMLGCLDLAHRWDARHVARMLVPPLCAALSAESLGQVWETGALTQQQELLAACRAFAHNHAAEVRPLYEAGDHFGRLVQEELAERVFPAARSQGSGGAESSDPAAGAASRKRRRTFA